MVIRRNIGRQLEERLSMLSTRVERLSMLSRFAFDVRRAFCVVGCCLYMFVLGVVLFRALFPIPKYIVK